eukprot:SAG31_NODE_8217_length_1494_cov_1.627240_2_plen_136_part_00
MYAAELATILIVLSSTAQVLGAATGVPGWDVGESTTYYSSKFIDRYVRPACGTPDHGPGGGYSVRKFCTIICTTSSNFVVVVQVDSAAAHTGVIPWKTFYFTVSGYQYLRPYLLVGTCKFSRRSYEYSYVHGYAS